MQLDSLLLYNNSGEIRDIRFRPGRLNIISGESGTGKSSIIGILRFLLGGDSPHVPLGPIDETVTWYGLLAHVSDTKFFIGRPAPAHGSTTNQAMLLVGEDEAPTADDLMTNSNSSDLVDYLGGLIGIEENVHVPPEGHTRRALAANFRHALYYNFQRQGEIANPDLLFHHQNRDFQKQAIRDTLPYFLGAQSLDALRKREQFAALRREVRRAEARLANARSAQETGIGGAAGLIADARANGLLPADAEPTNLNEAIDLLKTMVGEDTRSTVGDEPGLDAEMQNLLAARRTLRDELREINENLRGLDEFARVGTQYGSELNEHRVRLASIGLIPERTDPTATCPVCQTTLADSDVHEQIKRSLGRVTRRIDLAQRDRPRIAAARSELVQSRDRVREGLADLNESLDSLARSADIQTDLQQSLDAHSFIRGRAAQFLETTVIESDGDIADLERSVAELRNRAEQLADELDPEALRSAVNSILSIVGRDMTLRAQSLPLEHSEHGVRIDPYRLTVVADTLQGPAYMDAGAIGSGMSWVGYHLTAYLALHDYFIRANRPVPRFIVIDQPSQAFFPRDQESGGDLAQLSDTDRDNTRKLYWMMYDAVARLDGRLQIIAFDHADFAEGWFQESVIEKWRDGAALIPQEWIQ